MKSSRDSFRQHMYSAEPGRREEEYFRWADGWDAKVLSHLYSSSYYHNKHRYYKWNEKHIEWDNFDFLKTLFVYINQYEETARHCEKALCFPHKNLEAVFELYQVFGSK